MARARVLLSSVLALAFLALAAPRASAATIGEFSWQTDGLGTYLFGIDALTDWPSALVLTNVSVSYTLASGGTGSVAFADDLGLSTPSLQTTDLGGADPLDIDTATLQFSYDSTLGTVTVGSLGPLVIDADGLVLVDPQPIDFVPSQAVPVPEPSTLALVGSLLSGAVARRLKRRREGR